MKQYEELLTSLQNLGKDPSRLIFEDELTGIHNRRFLLNYLEHKVAWNVLETHPLSLIMVDLDKLKSINDTHGHQAGDQAIAEIARLIKDVTGPGGLPVRYAGDEFVILMPDTEKGEAVQVAERVLERVREEPMHLSGEAVNLPLTISLGVATAPADATTAKGLIHKADTALYHAKQSGRDRVANAAEIELQEVFGKSAIHQLEGADIIGRRSQLAEAAEAFEKFKHRQSQFLIVEGAAGMGKTTFLDTLRRTLVKSDIKLVKVNGIQQEGFRPYYLMTNLMIGLLNQLEDKGADAFASLGSREVAYLANILPQIQTSQTVELKEDEAVQREGIFTTLVQIVPKLLGAHSLVMLIDDLQYADEATLQLLRRLILRRQVPILVCGTTMDAVSLKVDHQELPLQGFCSAYQGELNLKTIVLKPLTAPDIDSHLRGLFPQITVPEGFDHNLASITQGNPLFLGEVLRKLVMDQKIILSGQRWMIRRLDEGYLPKSLEEIVRQKLAALDEQSRQLLDQASTFGEDVSLSFLTGSSKEMEAKVEEFVDQAVGLGLLSSEFQLNDETIRFLGKRVLDIVYGGIQQDRKQELHEQIGTYQESLYEQKLLPSASYLAYHFKRSTNQEKARTYEKVQTTYNARVFNAEAAASYTGDELSETEYVPPLDPASLPAIPGVVRALQTAIRNIKFYPPESQTIATANQQLAEAIQQILGSNEQLQIGRDPKTLLINGQKVDVSEYKILAEALVSFLGSIELKAIAFHRGLPEQELSVLLQTVGRAKTSEIDQLFWERFSSEQKL
ncbi:MAG: diguanylate cyclase, partial [Nitrospiraceae bacterium]